MQDLLLLYKTLSDVGIDRDGMTVIGNALPLGRAFLHNAKSDVLQNLGA